MGGKSPKLFSENTHSVVFTANIQKCPETYNTYWGGHIWPLDALKPKRFLTLRDTHEEKKRFLLGLCPKRGWRLVGGVQES